MAEDRYFPNFDAGEVRIQDLVNMTDNAGLADDRVLAELLRMVSAGSGADRAVMPYGKRDDAPDAGLASMALVQPGTGSNAGSVLVAPCRAIIGPRNTETDQRERLYRGQRSGYLVGATALPTVVPIPANASGGDTWVLVYATVMPDTLSRSEVIVLKGYTTETINMSAPLMLTKATAVTAQAFPTSLAGALPFGRPTVPADTATAFHIPLAYVFAPNGRSASTPIPAADIHEIAPVVTIHDATGAVASRPANQQHAIGGVVDTRQSGSAQRERTGAYLPPSMVGGTRLWIALQFTLSPASHADGDVIDNSRDWRRRLFTWQAHVPPVSVSTTDHKYAFAWDPSGEAVTGPSVTSVSTRSPSAMGDGASVSYTAGFGQSFYNDFPAIPPEITDCAGMAVRVTSDGSSNLPLGGRIIIYVRESDGALVLASTLGRGQILIAVDASGQFPNAPSSAYVP